MNERRAKLGRDGTMLFSSRSSNEAVVKALSKTPNMRMDVTRRAQPVLRAS